MNYVPTYDDVIAAYKLDILKPGGDLQLTASGDLDLTAYGDLKIGDDRVNAMRSLVDSWRFSAPTLIGLFKLVTDAQAAKRQFDDEMNNVASTLFDSSAPLARFHAIREEIGACAFGEMACAGAIMVMLQNLLMRFKNDLKATDADDDWDKCSPLIEGCSFGSVVTAAANNFRHHDEWARRDPPTEKQMKSIRVIAAVLKVPIGKNGNGHPFRRNVCPEVVEALSDGNCEELNRKFFAFAKNMAA